MIRSLDPKGTGQERWMNRWKPALNAFAFLLGLDCPTSYGGRMNELEIGAGLAVTPGYRYADAEGGRLFIAGQVPLDSEGGLVGPGDAAAQATSCLDNLALLVRVHEFDVRDVRQLTIYVVGDHDEVSQAWAAVRRWFQGDVPPATLLGVHLLGHVGQLVEIDACIVHRGSS